MKFKDAIDNSVKQFTSPTFIKEIKEEDVKMVKYLNILKKINENGYLTLESQSGIKRSGISPLDGKPYEINEKAYVIGFMLETDASEFIKNISLYTDKNAVFVTFCNDNVYLPKELDIPLTITKRGKDISVTTHTTTVLPNRMKDFYLKQAHINKSEKVVYILCWDNKWNRNASSKSGLFTDILKILNK